MLKPQTWFDEAFKYVLNAGPTAPRPAYQQVLSSYAYSFLERAVAIKRRRVGGYTNTTFHIVTPSPWPLLLSMAIFILILGGVKYMHSFSGADILVKTGFLFIAWGAIRWWLDVVYEGSYQGSHTVSVQRGLKIGFLLFIVSEIMFFAAFFWAFFHSSLSPAVEVGGGWPPVQRAVVLLNSVETDSFSYAPYMTVLGLDLFNPWHIPFLNTLLLLSSGAWVTYVHAALQRNRVSRIFVRRHYRIIPILCGSLARLFAYYRVLGKTKRRKIPRRFRLNKLSLI